MVYVPKLGGLRGATFELQFPHSKVLRTSLACTLIKQFAADGSGDVLSHGSGFFWRSEDNVHLVSARHVFSGLNPFTDDLMSAQGYIPDEIAFFPGIILSNGSVERRQFGLRLTSEEFVWKQDPEFRNLRTDIASLFLTKDPEQRILCLNDEEDEGDIMTTVGSACAVVGYPSPQFEGLLTPVWRSGAIASEPSLPIDKKPMFLLDVSTAPGFSGAPVFQQNFGPLPRKLENGDIQMDHRNVLALKFIGVYAGRLLNAHPNGEVPYVFYGNRVQEIVQNGVSPF